jgi:hypothetical protein
MSPRSFASRSMAPSAARSRPAPPSAKTPSRSLDSRAGPSHDVGARARYSSGNQSEEDETGRGRAREENNPSSLRRWYPNVFNQPSWAVRSFSTGWAGGFIRGASEPSLCSACAVGAADFLVAALDAGRASRAEWQAGLARVRARKYHVAVVASDRPDGGARDCGGYAQRLATLSAQQLFSGGRKRAVVWFGELGEGRDLTRGAPVARAGDEVAAYARGFT